MRSRLTASCTLPWSHLVTQEWGHYFRGEACGIFHCFLAGGSLRGPVVPHKPLGNRLSQTLEVGVPFYTLGIAV